MVSFFFSFFFFFFLGGGVEIHLNKYKVYIKPCMSLKSYLKCAAFFSCLKNASFFSHIDHRKLIEIHKY